MANTFTFGAFEGNGLIIKGLYKGFAPREEVGLEGVVGLSLKAMVGKFSYKAMNSHDIAVWDSTVWAPLIGYMSTISILPKGWYGFVFRKEEHATLSYKEHGFTTMGVLC